MTGSRTRTAEGETQGRVLSTDVRDEPRTVSRHLHGWLLVLVLVCGRSTWGLQQVQLQVSSVREVHDQGPRPGVQISPNGLRWPGATAVELIAWVFDISARDIVVEQSWARSLRFDIEAKPQTAIATYADGRELLKSVLLQRFSLDAGFEQQIRDVYAIVPVRMDGRLGPRLTRSTSDECLRKAEGAGGQGGQLPSRPADTQASMDIRCGIIKIPGSGNQILAIGGRGVDMGWLAASLSRNLDRTVIDRSGLEGFFDFDVAPTGSSADPLSAGAEFFTRFREQLGLRLSPVRAEVQILVVKNISRPSEN